MRNGRVIYKPVPVQDIRPSPVGCAGFFGGMAEECPVCARFRFNRDDAIQFYARRAGFRLHWARVEHRRGQLRPQDHRGGGHARPPRHGLRPAPGRLGARRLCELDGARWVYDSDELGAVRRDVITILTHHAASRQAAMAPYGRLLLTRDAE
jgi:hypothetical protein